MSVFCKDMIFKTLILGDGSVGKTTLLNRYMNGVFLDGMKVTIGVDIFSKQMKLDYLHIILQIWDFGGQDHFRFLQEGFILGAKGVLLCFDPTSPKTFFNLDKWMSLIKLLGYEVPIILVSTKSDLDSENAVDEDEVEIFIKKNGMKDYLRTSSKTGENVEYSFDRITEFMMADFNKQIYAR